MGASCVTPYVGVWIETFPLIISVLLLEVTPYVGVWIETLFIFYKFKFVPSHPTWVCGLKLI